LNYFFGQSGPGPVSGVSTLPVPGGLFDQDSAAHRASAIVPSGRDVSGSDPSVSSGLMASKRLMDGNNAAYDMKSLGRHIEAVCSFVSCEAQH
jgi:dynamin 1-like protein